MIHGSTKKGDRREDLLGLPVGERLDRRALEVCDAAGSFIEYWGFKSIQGRIWTLLALRTAPMGQSEIAEALGVSRSLVSTTISDLQGLGLVRQVDEHRNAPYEAVIDVWPTISDVLRSREWMLIEKARLALEAAIEEAEIADDLGRPNPWSVTRLRLLLTMTEMAQALLRLLIAIRVPRSLESFSEWIRKASTFIQSFRP